MTTTLTSDAANYFAAVSAELADLPEEDRAELLEDVEQHLAEVAAEGTGPLEHRLGTPGAYAAELRAAAGLPPRGARPGASLFAAPVDRARRLVERVRGTRAYAEVSAFAPELRPAWWVARAYLLVAALSLSQNDALRDVVPVPHVFGSALLGLVSVGAGVVVSVRVGRRRTWGGWRRWGLAAANTAAVVAALTVAANVSDRAGGRFYYPSENVGSGTLTGPYGEVTNVFPYDSHGQPLTGVYLFDQNGSPLGDMVYCADLCDGRAYTFPLDRPFLDRYGKAVPTLRPPVVLPGVTPTPTPAPTPAASAKPTAKPAPHPTPTP
ncbi:MAG: hypothetical protein QOE45_1211 [Frankiaceae bacterium]|jgi:hypothetical protein|nr:hypothetical protein [Frankiaceae bacterium]